MFMLSLIEKDVLNQPLKPYQSKNVCIYEILSHFRMMIKWLKIQTQPLKFQNICLEGCTDRLCPCPPSKLFFRSCWLSFGPLILSFPERVQEVNQHTTSHNMLYISTVTLSHVHFMNTEAVRRHKSCGQSVFCMQIL